MPTHTGEYSYHSKLPLPMWAPYIRAVHITFYSTYWCMGLFKNKRHQILTSYVPWTLHFLMVLKPCIWYNHVLLEIKIQGSLFWHMTIVCSVAVVSEKTPNSPAWLLISLQKKGTKWQQHDIKIGIHSISWDTHPTKTWALAGGTPPFCAMYPLRTGLGAGRASHWLCEVHGAALCLGGLWGVPEVYLSSHGFLEA